MHQKDLERAEDAPVLSADMYRRSAGTGEWVDGKNV